jgi:biopolymer transport protein ExbD
MPEAHIRGDVNTPYKCIGGTVFTMQRAGFARVGFISQPPPGGSSGCKLGAIHHGDANHQLNTEGEPMMDINTTPLIDVMLVLIIMLIITIPPQSHAVKLDLPQTSPTRPPPPIDPVKNKVVVTQAARCPVERRAGQPDPAAPVSRRHAADGPGSRASPAARADARYELVDEVLAVTKQAKVSKDGVRRQRSLYDGQPKVKA